MRGREECGREQRGMQRNGKQTKERGTERNITGNKGKYWIGKESRGIE